VEQLGSWFAEMVLALEHVHQRGIIHRDVKVSIKAPMYRPLSTKSFSTLSRPFVKAPT